MRKNYLNDDKQNSQAHIGHHSHQIYKLFHKFSPTQNNWNNNIVRLRKMSEFEKAAP